MARSPEWTTPGSMGREGAMAQGKVKWFNRVKGYGFIQTEDGADIFVHRTAIHSEGKTMSLKEGDSVTFDIEQGERGSKAVNVIRSEEG
jgi:cold shock protein